MKKTLPLQFASLCLLLAACQNQAEVTAPAVYQGVLPCADCQGQDWQLTLLDNKRYQLDIIYLGKDERIISHSGQYQWQGERLQLDNNSQLKKHEQGLQLLDTQGNTIDSELNYRLQALDDAPIVEVSGYYRYYADGHIFMRCNDDQPLPLQANQQRLTMEREYMAQSYLPEEGRFTRIRGQLKPKPEGEEGWPEQLYPLSYDGLSSARSCKAEALETHGWQLSELAGQSIVSSATLHFDSNDGRSYGSDGCNRFTGGYHLRGQTLSFGTLASTRMACPDQGQQDHEFLTALGQTRQYQLDNGRLVLTDGDNVLAAFKPLAD